MRYRELLIRTLADCARARFPFGYFTALSDVREDTRRAINTDGARPNAPPLQANARRNAKGASIALIRARTRRHLTKERKTTRATRKGGITLPGVRGKVLRRRQPPLLPTRRDHLLYGQTAWGVLFDKEYCTLSPSQRFNKRGEMAQRQRPRLG